MTVLTYDLETTGLPHRSLPLSHAAQPRIVQLGAILDDDEGNEIMRIDLILKPQDLNEQIIKSWRDAAKIHGIQPELAERVGVQEVTALDCLLDMIDAADVIVGQNIKNFDNGIVTGTTRRLHENDALDPFVSKQIFDTMVAAKPLVRAKNSTGAVKNPNLMEIHKYLFDGVGFDKAHTAINDVLACRRCYYELQRIAQEAREKRNG